VRLNFSMQVMKKASREPGRRKMKNSLKKRLTTAPGRNTFILNIIHMIFSFRLAPQ
jgi:hypothetical protein